MRLFKNLPLAPLLLAILALFGISAPSHIVVSDALHC